jgi:hypothetical protein
MKRILVILAAVTLLFIACPNPTNGKDGPAGPQGPAGENALKVYNSLGAEVGTLLAGTYVVTPQSNVIRIDPVEGDLSHRLQFTVTPLRSQIRELYST